MTLPVAHLELCPPSPLECPRATDMFLSTGQLLSLKGWLRGHPSPGKTVQIPQLFSQCSSMLWAYFCQGPNRILLSLSASVCACLPEC